MGVRAIVVSVAAVFTIGVPAARAAFTVFESGHVRPLAMSPDGQRLFAANTPDASLEVFTIDTLDGSLVREAFVPVGLEPVAVAARSLNIRR